MSVSCEYQGLFSGVQWADHESLPVISICKYKGHRKKSLKFCASFNMLHHILFKAFSHSILTMIITWEPSVAKNTLGWLALTRVRSQRHVIPSIHGTSFCSLCIVLMKFHVHAYYTNSWHSRNTLTHIAVYKGSITGVTPQMWLH